MDVSRVARLVVLTALGGLSACALFTDLSGLGGEKSPPADAGAADTAAPASDGGRISRDASTDVGAPPVVCTDKQAVGKVCRTDEDCCSFNCYDDVCEDTAIGSKCRTDEKCASNNCYDDVCEDTAIGSKCRTDEKCASNNCYKDFCEGNAAGSKCRTDEKCTSNRCINDVCQ